MEGDRVQASVKLFGRLGQQMGERSFSIEIDEGVCLKTLLELLEQRFGEEFSEAIYREPGVLQTYTRIFLNDEPISDLSTRVTAPDGTAEVGLILLSAVEGG